MRPSSPCLPDKLTQTSPTAPLEDEIGRLWKLNSHPHPLEDGIGRPEKPNSHPRPLEDGIGRPGKTHTHPLLLAEQAKTRFNRMTDTICATT